MLTTRSIRIEPLPDHAHIVAAVLNSKRVLRGWYYPPIHAEHTYHHPDVEVPDHAFVLPSTHAMTPLDRETLESELASFVVTALGFAVGMRLGLDGWAHYYRATTRKGELVDFFCSQDGAGLFARQAEEYQVRYSNTEVTNLMLGALHWYLLSQSYQHAFEILAAQCFVLDTCWHVFQLTDPHAPGKHIASSDRPQRMCDAFGIPLPEWARSGKHNLLSRIRNELFFEGTFAGEPVGFATTPAHTEPLYKELIRLNARLIVALFGIRSGYLATRVDDTELHDLIV